MFGKLLSAVIETAKLPVDATVDFVTLMDGERKPFKAIRDRVESVQEKLEEMDK